MKGPTKTSLFAVLALGLAAVSGWVFFRSTGRSESPTPRPSAAIGRFEQSIDATLFLKGNLHTHTNRSDGDSPPEEVVAWYRDHGYAFLSLTDHNQLTDVSALRHLERPGFVLVPGEEVTMTSRGKPIHVNGLCLNSVVAGGDFPTPSAALSAASAQIAAQGGVALINHPNFEWALRTEDVALVNEAKLLEIWSGHPFVRSGGDAFHPSNEVLWAETLDRGQTFAAVAVDDVHHLSKTALDPAARPGRAWVYAFSTEPTAAGICDALREGRLVASNGAEFARIVVEGSTFRVTPNDVGAQVEFLGTKNEILMTARATTEHPEAAYALRGGERFVRARITTSNGKRAWTQAYSVVVDARS